MHPFLRSPPPELKITGGKDTQNEQLVIFRAVLHTDFLHTMHYLLQRTIRWHIILQTGKTVHC